MVNQIAFVAMEFEGDPWNDKRYVVITEVLQEAGYEVIRGDDIKSSGPIMTEVMDMLRDADLVVIDSTGNSHNVSYEIGYCHGIDRNPSTVILLRNISETIPFNYSHFRHILYRDVHHLRSLLRNRLEITFPLPNGHTGFCLSFICNNAGMYGDKIAKAVISGLGVAKFTGRCEYYAADRWQIPGLYVVGLGLSAQRPRRQLSSEWWSSLTQKIEHELPKDNTIQLNHDLSEFTEMVRIRADQMARGVAEFQEGKLVQLLSGRSDDMSWFESAACEILNESNGT